MSSAAFLINAAISVSTAKAAGTSVQSSSTCPRNRRTSKRPGASSFFVERGLDISAPRVGRTARFEVATSQHRGRSPSPTTSAPEVPRSVSPGPPGPLQTVGWSTTGVKTAERVPARPRSTSPTRRTVDWDSVTSFSQTSGSTPAPPHRVSPSGARRTVDWDLTSTPGRPVSPSKGQRSIDNWTAVSAPARPTSPSSGQRTIDWDVVAPAGRTGSPTARRTIDWDVVAPATGRPASPSVGRRTVDWGSVTRFPQTTGPAPVPVRPSSPSGARRTVDWVPTVKESEKPVLPPRRVFDWDAPFKVAPSSRSSSPVKRVMDWDTGTIVVAQTTAPTPTTQLPQRPTSPVRRTVDFDLSVQSPQSVSATRRTISFDLDALRESKLAVSPIPVQSSSPTRRTVEAAWINEPVAPAPERPVYRTIDWDNVDLRSPFRKVLDFIFFWARTRVHSSAAQQRPASTTRRTVEWEGKPLGVAPVPVASTSKKQPTAAVLTSENNTAQPKRRTVEETWVSGPIPTVQPRPIYRTVNWDAVDVRSPVRRLVDLFMLILFGTNYLRSRTAASIVRPARRTIDWAPSTEETLASVPRDPITGQVVRA